MKNLLLLSLVVLTTATTWSAPPPPVDKSSNARKEMARIPHTPAPGSAERKAIALALHVPCERDLNQELILRFDQLRVAGNWAIARVRPLRPNGKSIDYRRTKYKERLDEGMFDGTGEALLQKENGRWTVLQWRFGGTDTEMSEWIKRHRAPKALAE